YRFFFFQAEDGIRDFHVTGVQTCALPISTIVLRVDGGMTASDWTMQRLADLLDAPVDRPMIQETTALGAAYLAGLNAGVYPEPRSEERRVGEECRSAASSCRYYQARCGTG